MEKRLPLAILLSLAVLVLFELFGPRPPRPAQPSSVAQDSAPAAQTESTTQATQATEGVEGPAPLIADAEEREFVIDFGVPGEVGHFRATFTNRGAELVELSTGTYFRRVGLDEQGRRDPSNWLGLIERVALPDGSHPRGAFALEPLESARDVAPVPLGECLWQAQELLGSDGSTRGIEFRYAGGNGFEWTKRYEASPGSWGIDLSLGLRSPDQLPTGVDAGPREFAMVAAGTIGVEVDDPFYKQPKAVAVGPADGRSLDLEQEMSEKSASKVRGVFNVPAPLASVGGHNKYFAVLLSGADERGQNSLLGASWRRFDALGSVPAEERDAQASTAEQELAWQGYIVADAQLALEVPPAGQSSSWSYRLYAGPKDHGGFLAAAPAHAEVLDSDLSWFSGIGNFLIDVLVLLERVTSNWGVAIILLTLLIRGMLFPLNRRSQTAMARYQSKMKRVQPKLDAIKERHKDDPQKLREAQAKLMQEEGAFPPLGGCLPIFLQMPIFFGLFAALRTSFDLRHAGFVGWIQDLSRPDQLLYLGWNVPLIGLEYLNVLPPLMVVMWIWQQRSMPQPSDEQARQMQRIMLFMPVVMGVFLYNYAAGLSLYMVTQSTLGIFEQKVIKKLWPIDDTEPEKSSGRGCAPFAEAMQRAAEQQQARTKELERQRAQGRRKGKHKR